MRRVNFSFVDGFVVEGEQSEQEKRERVWISMYLFSRMVSGMERSAVLVGELRVIAWRRWRELARHVHVGELVVEAGKSDLDDVCAQLLTVESGVVSISWIVGFEDVRKEGGKVLTRAKDTSTRVLKELVGSANEPCPDAYPPLESGWLHAVVWLRYSFKEWKSSSGKIPAPSMFKSSCKKSSGWGRVPS